MVGVATQRLGVQRLCLDGERVGRHRRPVQRARYLCRERGVLPGQRAERIAQDVRHRVGFDEEADQRRVPLPRQREPHRLPGAVAAGERRHRKADPAPGSRARDARPATPAVGQPFADLGQPVRVGFHRREPALDLGRIGERPGRHMSRWPRQALPQRDRRARGRGVVGSEHPPEQSAGDAAGAGVAEVAQVETGPLIAPSPGGNPRGLRGAGVGTPRWFAQIGVQARAARAGRDRREADPHPRPAALRTGPPHNPVPAVAVQGHCW